ncbi:MAG: phage tail protein [Phascolarctobacterium sp.]
MYDGVPKELMLYDQFEAWANNCDAMNLKINIEIVSVSDFWSIVNQDIAPVGRGLVVQFGTKFGCIYDHASQPVQLFNMGNIIQGSFELSYLGKEDRADVVEITYFDAANDYEKSVITIYADDYDDIDIPNQPTQLTYNGITSYEQAYREGKYQLYCNQFLQETITFKADVEAIGCQVGDQILVSHDVPEWSFSGRIGKVKADGSVVVALDVEEIVIPSGETWGIMVRNSKDNSLTTYTVASVSGKYGDVAVKATVAIKASEGDLFSLGRINSIVKPFIVKSLQKSGDLEYTISALEYVEGVYNEDYAIPEPEYYLKRDRLSPVENLKVTENVYTDESGNPAKTVYLTWDESGTANIYVSIDGGETYYLAGKSDKHSASIEVPPFSDYIVKVCATNGSIETTPAVYNGSGSAGAFDPAPVTNFRLTGQTWMWDAVDNGYIDCYELRLDENPGGEEGLLDRTFVKQSNIMPGIPSGTAYLYVRSKSGRYSEPAQYAFTISIPPKPLDPIITTSLDGANVTMEDLPAGCLGYEVEVTTHNGIFPSTETFTTLNNRFTYFLYNGHISVRYCFVNNIGKGEYSNSVQVDIELLKDYKIPDGEIPGTKIEENSITSSQIAANTIVANNLAAECVTSEKILAASITSEKIAANAVKAIHIEANAITAEKLAAATIDLTGMLSIVGGAVKLSEEGLRLTNNDNSYTLFNGDGINYVDKNGVVYAQVKKMIIGKAYDGQYIRFSAPWDSVPSVITVPMSIRTNDVNYQASTTTIVCEATEITQNGFRVNNYLKLAGGSYAVINANRSETLSLGGLASMSKYGYGKYTYHYSLSIYSDCLSISIPSTANYLEVSLNIASVNQVRIVYSDSEDSWTNSVYPGYPGANSGGTYADKSTWYIKAELFVGGSSVASVSYSTTSGNHNTNPILSASFTAGATSAFVRITYSGNFSTNDHGNWATVYNGWSYIAKAVYKDSKITMPYYKYSASESKIAQGYAMFLVTDGSTNTYTIE